LRDGKGKRIAEILPGESATPSAERSLTPAAKRVLLQAYERSPAAGVSCIGPEHIPGALLDAQVAE